MTYVRTKDGRVFIPDKKTFKAVGVNSVPKLIAYWYNGEPFTVDEIVKESKDLKGICDRFVYRQQLYEDVELMKGQDVPTINHTMVKTNDKIILSYIKDQIDMCDDKHIFSKKEWGKVYGAIWTDKGLIYVAKMNTKGELELL